MDNSQNSQNSQNSGTGEAGGVGGREGFSISEAEWDLLDVLWERRRVTAREAAEALRDSRGWAYSTVKTMLDRMMAKGLVHGRQVGNVWEYTPAVERDHARASAWRRFIGAAFGGAMAPALEFLASEGTLSRRERAMLLSALKEQDKSKGGGMRGRKEQR